MAWPLGEISGAIRLSIFFQPLNGGDFMKVKPTIFMLIAAAVSGMIGESIERGLNNWDEKRTAAKKAAADADKQEQAQPTEEGIEELKQLEEENP